MRCGEFDLAELAALVTARALYIGGDSGPLHVAATTRTPIVALFGPTLPERSLPWRDPAIPCHRVDAGPLALPPVPPAHVRPGRLPLPHRHHGARMRVRRARCSSGALRRPGARDVPARVSVPTCRERELTLDTLRTGHAVRPASPGASASAASSWLGLVALIGLGATMQFSIAAAQILLGVSRCSCWLGLHLARGAGSTRRRSSGRWSPTRPSTLLSAGFSLDSVGQRRRLQAALPVPAGAGGLRLRARRPAPTRCCTIIITVGAASAFVGIVQYGILNYDNLGPRACRARSSHWMTYSGTLMLVICASLARLLFGTRDRLWAAFVLPALLVSLALTLTRGAWLGAAAGAAVLFLIKDIRLTALMPVVAAIVLVVAPDALSESHELDGRHERPDDARPRGDAARRASR